MNREKNLQHAFSLNCLENFYENQQAVQILLLLRLYVSCAGWQVLRLLLPLIHFESLQKKNELQRHFKRVHFKVSFLYFYNIVSFFIMVISM